MKRFFIACIATLIIGNAYAIKNESSSTLPALDAYKAQMAISTGAACSGGLADQLNVVKSTHITPSTPSNGQFLMQSSTGITWGTVAASAGGGIKWTMHLYPQQARPTTSGSPVPEDWEKEDTLLISSVPFATVLPFDITASSQFAFYNRAIDTSYAGGNVKCTYVFLSSAIVTGTLTPCVYVSTVGYTTNTRAVNTVWTPYVFSQHTVGGTAFISSSATITMTAPFKAGEPVTIGVSMSRGTFAGTIGVCDVFFEEQ